MRTNMSEAIAVFAPPRLSTMTCWPRYSPSFGATTRATMSLVPPGGKPTMKRMGFEGYAWPDATGATDSKQGNNNQQSALFIFSPRSAVGAIFRTLNLPSPSGKGVGG